MGSNPKPIIFLAFANDRSGNFGYLRNLPEEARQVHTALDAAHNPRKVLLTVPRATRLRIAQLHHDVEQLIDVSLLDCCFLVFGPTHESCGSELCSRMFFRMDSLQRHNFPLD